ncbi:MAG: hypothetical protein GVY34_10300, partial [Alphaproteobacteria bacterium]|nr:hypothetical protein [Alphaproteobacteria bacterium]
DDPGQALDDASLTDSVSALIAQDTTDHDFVDLDAQDDPALDAPDTSELPHDTARGAEEETAADVTFAEPGIANAAMSMPSQPDDEDDFGLFDEDDPEIEDTPATPTAPVPDTAAQTGHTDADAFADDADDMVADDAADPVASGDVADDTFEELDDRADDGLDGFDRVDPTADTEEAEIASQVDMFDDAEFEAELERELADADRKEQEHQSIDSLRSEIREVLGNTGLPDGSESALVEELAEIEQEAVIKHPHFDRKLKKRIPGDTDITAERLLETANSELGERDTQRRRKTFEHIKVAVAATRAEEAVEGPRRRDIEQDREIDKYRAGMDTPAPLEPAVIRSEQLAKTRPDPADLQDTGAMDDTVRDEEDTGSADAAPVTAPEPAETPRRPAAPAPAAQQAAPDAGAVAPRPRRPAMVGERRTERPKTSRTPLVLVSEQRVDSAPQASDGPVRPRRVRTSAAAEAVAVEAEQQPVAPDTLNAFKSFADDVDAWLLDDQIEAAAAYSTHILGRDEFSRPELVKFVLAYNADKEVSREDMLRGFGTLLREGRLERGSAGTFRLAPASEYDEPARNYARR